ncbi:MAG: hypothetical protein JNN28_06825 [Saprospiraceae bacterium]|nr:hypothetical protein [Saprospiraceae bacterium]
MKHYFVIALIFNLMPTSTFAQLGAWFHDLEGCWVEDGRKSASFILWEPAEHQTIRNSTYSLLCGDTLLLHTMLIHFTEKNATLEIHTEDETQYFQLYSFNNNTLKWKNNEPDGLPQQLSWTISLGKNLQMRTDDLETDFTRVKEKDQILKWTLGVSLGGNMSNYGNAITFNHFLWRNNISSGKGTTEMLGGFDFAFRMGLQSPLKTLGLSAEMGITQRNVGIHGSFYSKDLGTLDRDGYYRTNSLYAAFIPEFYLDRMHRIAIQSGFYAVLTHNVQFMGHYNTRVLEQNQSKSMNPSNDIDMERGFLLGLQYRVVQTGALKPELFMRYCHGINSTHVRALTIGVATDF